MAVDTDRDEINTCKNFDEGRDSHNCHRYVNVYLGLSKRQGGEGNSILTTDVNVGTQEYNVNRWVRTPKIKKSDTITVEVLHDLSSNHDKRYNVVLLRESGTVQSFIEKPRHCSEPGTIKNAILSYVGFSEEYVPPNCIEVDIIWQDERN